MKISVVTVAFNSSRTIGDTIRSVLSQTHPDIEYIVVDGLSTDRTMDIVRQFQPEFKGRMRWISEPDRGIYDAMNKGMAMASGDIIGLLNSDDIYQDENVLADIDSYMSRHNADIAYGDMVFVSPNNPDQIIRTWQSSQHRPGAFFKGWHPAPPTFYVRRTVFERLGGFDTSLDVSADFELMLRYIERQRVSNIHIPRVLVRMRYGGESTGSISKIILGNRNVLKAFRLNGYRVPRFYLLRRLLPKAYNILRTNILRIAKL
ncbi:MAG: glycosyltransferase [Muribaculaceae bacterium]|nr:glycosyltransferase [Muribaculaceae bacterium]